MPRFLPSKSDTERSQKLLQRLISNESFATSIAGQSIRWVSPVADDDFAEYNDADFLKRLGVAPEKVSLHDFWPKMGPHWDALGVAADGTVILVEAKAYIEEMDTDRCKASPASLEKIEKSLSATSKFMGAKPKGNWARTFYQMTNRLAHLYYLHSLNRIPTELWFVCFCNHPDPRITTSKEEWLGAIRLVESHLGIQGGRHKLKERIRHIFVDSESLQMI
jgi:hypothetical protein